MKFKGKTAYFSHSKSLYGTKDEKFILGELEAVHLDLAEDHLLVREMPPEIPKLPLPLDFILVHHYHFISWLEHFVAQRMVQLCS